MSSILEGYNYDIFISCRSKNNKYDRWVTEFVDNLKKEPEAAIKDKISVYFDINPLILKLLNSVSIKATIFILLLSFTTLFSCSTGKQSIKVNNSLDEMGLKGKVRSVIETEYDADEKLGKIQKGDMLHKTIHMFNENGDLIERTVHTDDGRQSSKVTCAYDKNGKVSEMTNYLFEKLERRVTYVYDNKGNEIERNIYQPDNSLSFRTISRYDGHANKIWESYYKPDGSLESKILFKYDDKGNQVESIGYNSDGSIFLKSTCKYNEKGRMIERTNSVHPLKESKFDINENLKSAMEEYTMDKDFKYVMKEDFKYDDTGKLIDVMNDYGNDLRKATYKYDRYDNFGNWLYKFKEDELLNSSSPMSVTEREIEYY